MAASAGTIDVSMPKVMSGLTLRVRFVRLAGFRVSAASWLMKLAGIVAGIPVAIEVGVSRSLEFTADGIPVALSTLEDRVGYSPDAADYGRDLIVYLDGVEQAEVLAYDMRRGVVTRIGRLPGLWIEHLKGVVTVERIAR